MCLSGGDWCWVEIWTFSTETGEKAEDVEPDASGWVDVGSEQADLQWHELRKSKINFLTFSGYLT